MKGRYTRHLPEFAELIEAFTGADGKTRYKFLIESGTKGDPPYEYFVSSDGTRPVCLCRTRHPYARSCRLEDPAYAREMAERGRKALAGVALAVGF